MENLILSCITQDLKNNKSKLADRYKKSKNNSNSNSNSNNNNPVISNIKINADTKTLYFSNAVTNENELINTLGRKWKSDIVMIGAFIDVYQYITPNDYYIPLPIATTSKRLLQIFNSPMTISRILDLSQNIGLLRCIDEKYSYTYNKAKVYYYNKDVQNLVKETIEKYGLVIPRKIKKNYTKDFRAYNNTSYKIGFSSKLRIGGNPTDNEIMSALNKKYPQLSRYQKLADKLNKSLPQELAIRFTPHIKTSAKGYITKIGIRATSSIVSLKEHENEHKDYKGVWRKDFLKEYFGTDKYYEYDVKSSIYRIAYLLKHGVWLDDSIDVYELMNGSPFEDKEDRDNYKQFAQRLYFDSPERIYHNIENAIGESIYAFGEDEVKESIRIAKQNMEDVIGDSIDSEIFLHESCIYMEFFSKLRESLGLDVVQVYDGFYCLEDLSCYKDLLEGIALEYYHRYICKDIEDNNNNNNNNNRDIKIIKDIIENIGIRIGNIKILYNDISLVNTFKRYIENLKNKDKIKVKTLIYSNL